MEQIQHLVQHFQAISTWKGWYIPCYGRLGVEVLRDFNHPTIQVYVYNHALSTLILYTHHLDILNPFTPKLQGTPWNK